MVLEGVPFPAWGHPCENDIIGVGHNTPSNRSTIKTRLPPGAKDDARGVIVLVMVRDTDVIPRGSSLKGLTILLGIAGGIAAVESVRLARELRRHGASLRIVMTTSAQSILRPKALEWASQEQVITAWDPALKQLDDVDGLLIAPATRNLMASHLHGMMSSPLLMAMSGCSTTRHTGDAGPLHA